MSKAHPDDEQNTIRLLRDLNSDIEGKITWLRHKADCEAGTIDRMLLLGNYPLEIMVEKLITKFKFRKKDKKQWEERIKSHLRHLGKGEHNLKVKTFKSGKIAFDY